MVAGTAVEFEFSVFPDAQGESIAGEVSFLVGGALAVEG